MKIVTVPGSSAMDEMSRLLVQRASTGLHPILFGKREAADAIALDYSQATDLKEVRRVVAKSQKYDLSREVARFFEPDELDETELEERRAEKEWVRGESGESVAEENQEYAAEDEDAVLHTCMDVEDLHWPLANCCAMAGIYLFGEIRHGGSQVFEVQVCDNRASSTSNLTSMRW